MVGVNKVGKTMKREKVEKKFTFLSFGWAEKGRWEKEVMGPYHVLSLYVMRRKRE